jgi:prepilin-type N-terminal cleavage/methylation domain-containing protein
MRRITRAKLLLGFTLIELLVVIAIVGILFAVGTSSYITAQRQVRDSRRKTDLLEIQQALETYRSENGFYPDNGTWDTDLVPTYMNSVPADPKEGNYRYIGSGGAYNSSYSLCTELEIIPTSISLTQCASPENYEVRSP